MIAVQTGRRSWLSIARNPALVSIFSNSASVPMMNNGGGNYNAKFSGISNPQKITVTSDLGGSATARVKVR